MGFEGSPTLLEKQERLREEKNVIGNLKYVFQEQCVKNKVLVEKISEDIKENVLKSIRKVLTILSRRLQELRKTHLSKEQALVKLKTMAGPDWRKRKLVFVISALETNRFDIKSNIDGLLEMINKLGKNV